MSANDAATNAIREGRVEVNGLAYAYLEAGTGPLALCVHGFPDTAWGWEPLLLDLAAAGYHAVAPFMRGYAPTAVPEGESAPLGAWIADVHALHDALGDGTPAVLIGHDWGAITTYGAASSAPERWSRIVTLSIPPSGIMAARLLDYDQVKRFWYQYVILQPTAELIIANDDFAFLGHLWSDWSPGYDNADAVARVKDALRGPGNLTAALNIYRTLLGAAEPDPAFLQYQFAVFTPHPQPSLYLHGETDGCVAVDVVEPARGVLPEGSRAERVAHAGHFLQYEQPAVVNAHILDFLGS